MEIIGVILGITIIVVIEIIVQNIKRK